MRNSKGYIRNTGIFYSVPGLRNTGRISMWIVARIIQRSLSKPFRPRQLLSYSGTMIVRSHVLCIRLDLLRIRINPGMFGITPRMKYVCVMRVNFCIRVLFCLGMIGNSSVFYLKLSLFFLVILSYWGLK